MCLQEPYLTFYWILCCTSVWGERKEEDREGRVEEGPDAIWHSSQRASGAESRLKCLERSFREGRGRKVRQAAGWAKSVFFVRCFILPTTRLGTVFSYKLVAETLMPLLDNTSPPYDAWLSSPETNVPFFCRGDAVAEWVRDDPGWRSSDLLFHRREMRIR